MGQKAYRLTLPTDGWTPVIGFSSGNPNAAANRVLDQDMFGLPTPLRPGDEIVAVAGHNVTGWEYRGLRGQLVAPSNWQAGQTVAYTIRRHGRMQVVDVPLRRWTAAALLNSALRGSRLPVYTVLPGLLLAGLVFFKRPHLLTAQLMLLQAAAQLTMFISWLGSPGGFEEFFAGPTVGWLAAVFSHFTPGLMLAPLGLAVVLSFPPGPSLLARYPRRVMAGLIAAPAAVLIIVTGGGSPIFLLLLIALAAVLSLAWLITMLFTVQAMPQRAQVRWLALAFGLGLIGLALNALVIFGLLPPAVGAWSRALPSELLVSVALTIAILRHNLFDIDLILNRALVYGALTALIVGLYVFVVGYLGALFRTEDNLAISLAATGLAAVAFQPLREWLQRGVNRLLYGRRDEPVAVLTALGARLEAPAAPEELLSNLLAIITQALKLPYAAIAVAAKNGAKIQAQTGRADSGLHAFPLIYQGQEIGQLLVSPRTPGDNFNPADRLLLTNIASQTAAAVHALRLSAALQQSRRQIITAREEERRRLRRDLHDGLGPVLAGQTLTIDAVCKLLPRDPATAAALLQTMKGQAQAAIQDIRRLVYDLRPPALDELGLLEALRESARQYNSAGWQVTVEAAPAPLPPLPAAIELAVYRIVREAITNATRHAQTCRCAVHIEAQPAHLTLSIIDDGPGFPPAVTRGVGLNSMQERTEELGGRIVFDNLPKGGARVWAWLPLPQENL